jgi:hypothetical protein
MDGDRRRKTVIAGTFAIARKSLSNAQPISADKSQRTKAEMTMASMYVPTLHEARAEGIYARALKTPSAISEESRPVPASRSQDPLADRPGEKSVDAIARWPSQRDVDLFFLFQTSPVF